MPAFPNTTPQYPFAEVLAPIIPGVHPAWLPELICRPLGAQRIALVPGDWAAKHPDDLMGQEILATFRLRLEQITEEFGGALVDDDPTALGRAGVAHSRTGTGNGTLVFALVSADEVDGDDNLEAYTISTTDTGYRITATNPRGLLYGYFELIRLANFVHRGSEPDERVKLLIEGTRHYSPAARYRMLDHRDNLHAGPPPDSECCNRGDSIFYSDGKVPADLSRVTAYARLLCSIGINRVCINNANAETDLIGDLLPDAERIAAEFRKWGITTFIAVSWAAPIQLGGRTTTDPMADDVRRWWRETADRVWATIPDFGGFVVEAVSDDPSGPAAYGRTVADGTNMLAEAVAPHGGQIYWRAADDRVTEESRSGGSTPATGQVSSPDGKFADNVIVQLRPSRERLLERAGGAAMLFADPRIAIHPQIAAESQIGTEFLGPHIHALNLAPMWSALLHSPLWGPGSDTLAHIIADSGGFVGVSNVGDDEYWTGHPLAQANLYAFGRLAWNPDLDPAVILDEWIGQTFSGVPLPVRMVFHQILADSWNNYDNHGDYDAVQTAASAWAEIVPALEFDGHGELAERVTERFDQQLRHARR